MDCTTETTTTPRHRAGRAARDTYDEKANHGQESVARQPTLDDGDDVRDANDQHHDFREKIADILHACQWNDLGGLRSLAESPGGFVNDALRQKACRCYTAALWRHGILLTQYRAHTSRSIASD